MDAVIVAVNERRRLIRRNRIFRDRNNALEVPDDEFKNNYRLPRYLALLLIDDLRGDLEWATRRSHALPVVIQVLICLRLLATGSFQCIVGQIHFHMVHQSTVSRTLRKFTNAMCRRLPHYVKFPKTREEINNVKLGFNAGRDFPGVIGCIDGTHIQIRKPTRPDAFNFVNRKSVYSLNVQGVCDANMKFLDIVARWPGSAHDSHMYNNSELRRHLHRANALPPLSWLLGDSGYPQEFCLMIPVLRPTTLEEHNYNQRHRSTRNVIERAFGVLKMRWLCLANAGGTLLYTPPKVVKMIGTCCVLHNLCIDHNVPVPEGQPEVQSDDEDDAAEVEAQVIQNQQDRAIHNRGEATRAALIATRFNRA